VIQYHLEEEHFCCIPFSLLPVCLFLLASGEGLAEGVNNTLRRRDGATNVPACFIEER